MTSDHNTRLTSLRKVISARGVDGFLIPRADEHLGEYVPAAAERLAFVTGFTGSAGLAVVLKERAAVWSDGRYTLQLQQETDEALWERLHLIEQKPEDWLKANAAGMRIGYDPWLISADALKRFAGTEMVPVACNPVDEVWKDRPPAPAGHAFAQDQKHAGESSAHKRARLGEQLRAAGQDAAILSDPAALAWLLNIRGDDIPFTPVALGYGLLFADGTVRLFMAEAKLTPELHAHLGTDVSIAPPDALKPALQELGGRKIRYDPATQPVWFKMVLEAAGARLEEAPDPVALPRACKNAVEQEGARAAHRRDGAALVRFLSWFAKTAPGGSETEMSAAARLLAERESGELFRGESFPAISGAGEHAAIIHYRVTRESNRAIKPDEIYLIDSGGQYLDGTTDVTRTIWTGPGPAPADIKANATRVLAGMIALAMAVFPEGVAGPHLDALARTELWQAGLDYDHGTGHGVGAYLAVHEGPASISRAARPVPLQPGMILSDEPGFYPPGQYGIRSEILLLVQPAELQGAVKKFLRFEPLTLAPFDRALIEPGLLAPAARDWLNAYHARVRTEITPLLRDDGAKHWLCAATAPI